MVLVLWVGCTAPVGLWRVVAGCVWSGLWMGRVYSVDSLGDVGMCVRRSCVSFTSSQPLSSTLMVKMVGFTSVTTVQWSLKSGLGIKFRTPGGASADFRGGFAVK